MSARALITVIIPLYNKERFIARALKSVLAQTVDDYEVVVVDDGSTDRSAEVVSEFRDPRFRIVRQENLGPGAARNRGAQESRSECVTFLDADDELLPDFLAQNIGNLHSSADCAMSLCGFLVGPNRQLAKQPSYMPGGPWRLPRNIRPERVREILYSLHFYGVIRKREFLALGGYYENGCRLGEDSYIFLKVLLNHRIYIEPTPLLWYHSENAELCFHYTKNGSTNWAEITRAQPLPPSLTDPADLLVNCPAEYRSELEHYLSYEALMEAQTRASVGDRKTVQELRERFPRMTAFAYNYAKLLLNVTIGVAVRNIAQVPGLSRVGRC